MAALISSFPLGAVRRRRLPISRPEPLRIAQVTLPDTLFEGARYFPPVQGSGLQQFSPQVLVGSAYHLSVLAEAVRERHLRLAGLSHAAFVTTDCRDVPVQEHVREALWSAFGVPVYELLLDGQNLPLAVECDAHEGWHVEPGISFFAVDGHLWFRLRRGRPMGTGLVGHIEERPCPCGRPGKRIMNAGLDFRDPVRACLSAIA